MGTTTPRGASSTTSSLASLLPVRSSCCTLLAQAALRFDRLPFQTSMPWDACPQPPAIKNYGPASSAPLSQLPALAQRLRLPPMPNCAHLLVRGTYEARPYPTSRGCPWPCAYTARGGKAAHWWLSPCAAQVPCPLPEGLAEPLRVVELGALALL